MQKVCPGGIITGTKVVYKGVSRGGGTGARAPPPPMGLKKEGKKEGDMEKRKREKKDKEKNLDVSNFCLFFVLVCMEDFLCCLSY
jgi:hypothetical protein